MELVVARFDKLAILMMMKKTNPTRRSKTKKSLTRRLGHRTIWFIAPVAVAFQVASCSEKPDLPTFTSTVLQEKTPRTSTSFKDCPQFFAEGVAPIVPKVPMLRELCYDSFAVLHSGSTKTPVFVAQRLNRASVADADEQRTDKFFADARLPRAERAELSDYKGSGYSRGHMAPAGDMPNPTAMAQSFSLANMVPQNPRQNSGPWAKIEKDTRHYVSRAKGDVYVITGPFFSGNSPTIGANKVHVPSHIFKLVYDSETKRAWAHWQENSNNARADNPISFNELKQRIGMNLLPEVKMQ